MLKSEAAAYLAGVTQTEGAEASAPTNLHVITGEVGEASADGKTLVKIDGLMFSESDDQFIEVDALGGLEEGDIATIVLTGEQGHAMTPLALGSIGSVDRITVRIAAIEADYIKVEQLDAAKARIGELEADHVSVDDFNAATGRIGTLETTRATITDLNAATARIGTLEADHVSTDDFNAATGRIGTLETNTADIGTIRANSAKVQNLTAAELEADHATVGSLSTNYAHITNGVIDNAKIGYADVNNLSAHYAEIQNGKINSALIDTAAIVDEQVFTVTGNKATLAQIDASKINVLNLKAKDIEVERINGQPVTNKTLVDALSQHESDISGLDSKIDDEVEALNDRIDGAIETFTGTVVPTLENTPASQWNTVKLKDQHVGDVYYVVNSQSAQNGYCYRFTKSGSTYSWQLIKDSDVTAALSRLQTAEGKIGNIETFDETVGSFMTNTEDEISSLKTKDTQLETSLGDKVSTSTFNTVSQKVDTNEANITSMSTVLTNNGLTSSTNITNTVNTVKQTADTNKASITNLTQTVNNKADGSTVTTLTNRVSTVEQNLSGITTRVGKTEQSLESVANPNLTPYFSADPTDVYNATTNPHGYWHVAMNAVSGNWTQLEDGWARLSKDNSSGTGSAYGNVRTEQISTLKPNTDYTLMVEARNVTISGTVYLKGIALRSGTGQFASTQSQTLTTVSSAVFYQHAKTVADLSRCKESTSGYIQINAGASITGDFRFSLYESAVVDINGTQTIVPYDGPYKPYVEQTLVARMRSAETSIEQNAENITLRATKTEAYQSAQPNLTPFFSVHNDDGTYPVGNANGYWQPSSDKAYNRACFTALDDGWAHLEACNSVQKEFVPPRVESLNAGDKVTMMVEWRDAVVTGNGPNFYTRNYAQQVQLSSNWYFLVTDSPESGVSYHVFTVSSTATGEAAWNGLVDVTFTSKASSTWTGDIRISFYKGVYNGPYKPYSGELLYATQSNLETARAEIKVTTDGITSEVEKKTDKATIISTINQSAETVKIKAEKVEIDGTAVFSAISSDVDDAITSKGYQTSSQVNSAITSKGYATMTQAQGYATTAKSEAISAAASDATSKANAAQTAATNAANTATDNKLKSYSTTAQANNLYDAKGAAAAVETNSGNLFLGASMADRSTFTNNSSTDFSRHFRYYNGSASIHSFSEYSPGVYQDTVTLESSGNLGIAFARMADEMGLDSTSSYTITCWAKCSKAGMNLAIGLSYYNTSNSWVWRGGTNATAFSAADTWQKFSLTFKPDADTKAICYCFTVAGGTGSETFTIRNCWLEKNAAYDAQTTANAAAPKANAVKRTQRIYYRSSVSTAPATMPTAWVTETNNKWAKNNSTVANWSTKVTPIANGTGATAEKYLYLWTCEQREMANGTLAYTNVLLDDSTTVIDGGNVITNSITANQIAANAVTADKLAANSLTIGKFTDADKAKVDNSYVSQRNLSPYFSAAPYDDSVNTYWRSFQTGKGYTFTEMEDGWMRVRVTNSTDSTIQRDFFPIKSPTVEPGKDYTFLFEFRNNNSSGTAKDTDCYIVQTNNYQFWGGTIKKNLEGKNSSSTTNLISDFVPGTSGVYTKRFVKTSEAVGSSHWTEGKEENVVGLAVVTCRCAANTTIDYELRVSVYEGEYTGPYRPYVGSQLYATGTALSDSSDRLEELIDGLDERTTNTENSLETTSKNLNDAVKDIESLNKKYTDEKALRDQWMDFTRSEGLVIGDNKSEFKTVIGSESMEFKNGDITLAKASGTEFGADVMRSEELHIGKWMWTKRNEGNNLSLKWVG